MQVRRSKTLRDTRGRNWGRYRDFSKHINLAGLQVKQNAKRGKWKAKRKTRRYLGRQQSSKDAKVCAFGLNERIRYNA